MVATGLSANGKLSILDKRCISSLRLTVALAQGQASMPGCIVVATEDAPFDEISSGIGQGTVRPYDTFRIELVAVKRSLIWKQRGRRCFTRNSLSNPLRS